MALIVVVAALVAVQVLRSPPSQAATIRPIADVRVPGSAVIRWPVARQAAVQIRGLGPVRTVGRPIPVAVASLAKMMTAYVVEHDHPLAPGEAGPAVPVTPTDAATYARERAANDSVVAVVAGESLSEQQALQALLVPSADNVATILARWDAGSVGTFVAKMNAEAASLHLAATRYTDPSGLDASTVSTARDQLVVTRDLMSVPSLAAIVAMPTATLPVVGSVHNYDSAVGHHGIIGVKTGSDLTSLGCWAFAARRTVAGVRRTVYGVVLGVTPTAAGLIAPALAAGARLADAVARTYRQVTVVAAGTVVGYVRAPWRAGPVPVEVARAVEGVARAGTTIQARTVLRTPGGGTVASNQQLGTITVDRLRGVTTSPMVAAGSASGPSLSWRLTRS